MATKGIITIATGSPVFLDMARDLAFSLRLHCDHIPRAIVTDSDSSVLAQLFDVVIPCRKEFGDGFNQKLYLDHYTPFQETLFIDSDSLVLRNLDFIWAMCRNHEFGYTGSHRQDGLWNGADIAYLRKALGLNCLATLNSGMLYYKSGEISRNIFARARKILLNQYESLGFAPFRDTRNDEAGFAIALSEKGLSPLQDYGRTMRTPIGIQGRIRLDVLRGECEFIKNGERVRPAIMHFATWQYHPIYYRERAKLRIHYGPEWARSFARLVGLYVFLRESASDFKKVYTCQ
jgi:hypothetical protein